jgi:hypothetical protein
MWVSCPITGWATTVAKTVTTVRVPHEITGAITGEIK